MSMFTMMQKTFKIIPYCFPLIALTILLVVSSMTTHVSHSHELQEVLKRNDKQIRLINAIKENISKDSKERKDLYKLAADFGIESIEDIKLDINYGKSININISIYERKEYKGNRYSQKILNVFSDKFDYGKLMSENVVKRGEFYSNHNQVNVVNGCGIRDSNSKIEAIVDNNLSCKDISNMITEIRNGNIQINKSLVEYLKDFDWKHISVRSYSSNIFQINSMTSETSSKRLEVEKRNKKYFLLSISIIEN